MDIKFDIIPEIPRMLKEAAFTDVETLDQAVPLGTWPKCPELKEIGAIFRCQLMEKAGLQSYTLALFTRNGWSFEECQVLYARMRKEIRENQMHLYTYW